MKVAGSTKDYGFDWVVSGRTVRMRAWRKTETGEQDPVEFRYKMSEEEKRDVYLALQSEHVRVLARRYEDRCVENPEELELVVKTHDRTQSSKMIGYVPPGVINLFLAIAETFPSEKRAVLGDKCPPACVPVFEKPSEREKQKTPEKPVKVSPKDETEGKAAGDKRAEPDEQPPDEEPMKTAKGAETTQPGDDPEEEEPEMPDHHCMDPELGIVHHPVEEFWQGKSATLSVITPRGWKPVVMYRAPLDEKYNALPMAPAGPNDPCHYKAVLPQSALGYDTLYYYIAVTDEEGKEAEGSAHRHSPHIAVVEKCLVITR